MEQDTATTNVCGPEACLLYAGMFNGCDLELTNFPDLSLEFLMGRALDNAMLNVGLKDVAKGSPSSIQAVPHR
jgi:hypothetical protein